MMFGAGALTLGAVVMARVRLAAVVFLALAISQAQNLAVVDGHNDVIFLRRPSDVSPKKNCAFMQVTARHFLGMLEKDFLDVASQVPRLRGLLLNLTRHRLRDSWDEFPPGESWSAGLTCFETLQQDGARLAAWLLIFSPRWGAKRVEGARDTDVERLYKGLDEALGARSLCSTITGRSSHATRELTAHIVHPSNLAFSQRRAEGGASWNQWGPERRHCAVGPYDAFWECIPHHEALLRLPPAGIPNDYVNGFHVDFLGCRQRPEGDSGSAISNVFRWVTATRGEALREFLAKSRSPAPLPFVDEEYFEYVDLLSSVLEAYDEGADVFTVVELGAGSGAPWASRAIAAWRRLRPEGRCRVGLIEASADLADKLRNDLELLGLAACETQVLTADVRSVSLAEILGPSFAASDARIDYLDIDVQGAELEVVGLARRFLRERVRRIHIGTHARDIHFALERDFELDGWKVQWSFPTLSFSPTPLGRVAFVDGVLTVVSSAR
eukprot:TRINITY_DN25137_c1_g2_i1.p1 TRINITY_DN25137_c1_g2~~TRINITY_DN25137_c1_g2_i1.p1  ORF type:complete len:498 (-),score=86.65 TRINITY_DN25137_c1_g2_i1:83-1576(-)